MPKKPPRPPIVTRPEHPRGFGGEEKAKESHPPAGELQAKQRTTGRTIYDTIVDDVFPLLLNPRTGIPILILLVTLVGLFFWFKTDGISYETRWAGVRLGGTPAETQSTGLRKCLAEARRLDKPYAIEAITYLIQFEKDSLNNQPAIRESRRIFYTLRSLRPINNTQDIFIEDIHTHAPNAISEHWFGNEKEVFHNPNNKGQFNVFFDMEKDDVRTVVTGANFLRPLPFETRSELEGHLTLLPNQDFEAYPNEADAICELNIIVESKTLQIQPVGDAAKRFFEANLKNEEAKMTSNQGSNGGPRTISARWRNVMIGETVGVHFTWPQ